MADNGLPTHPPYDVVIARGLRAPMRDGVTLSTDVYRPAVDGEPLPGPFPAIMTRSPYDTRSGKGPSSQARNGEFFAANGYLYAAQDVRGAFESEGDFVLLDGDGPDGHDAIEWLAALPYCDGNVGTQGTSLRAWNQNAAALERPPSLKAMWINQGGSNGNVNALRHNGAFELRWLTWAVAYSTVARESRTDPATQRTQIANAERIYEWLERLPWSKGDSPLAAVPRWEQWALDLYTSADADEFWTNPSRNFEPYRSRSANVPTMYAGSWYDSYSLATIEKFNWFQHELDNQYLLMGPGVHGGPNFDRPMAGEVDMGPRSTIAGNLAESRLHLMLRWFDRWLKGVDNGVDDDPRVRLFVMGGGGGEKTPSGHLLHGGDWREEEEWPIPAAVETVFRLGSDGELSVSSEHDAGPEDGGAGKTTFTVDPANPLPTIAGNLSSMTENLPVPGRARMPDPTTLRRSIVIQGAADQVTRADLRCEPPFGPLADRADVVVFDSPPLSEPVELIGPVELRLSVSCDAPDTDIFAMLLDVYPAGGAWPSGYRLNLADSIMRLRYREGMDRPKLMTPDEIVRVRFELYPVCNRFDVGHRIQLMISGSSFPRFDVNPNTGEPIGRHGEQRSATITLHHGPDNPSEITLPVVAPVGLRL